MMADQPVILANHIDGRAVAPIGGRYLDDLDPATLQVAARVPDSDAQDVDRAVEAARAAFPGWSRTPAAERSRLLLALADAVDHESGSLARSESVDSGKPISLACSLDIPRAVANLRFFATAILHDASELHATDGRALNYTIRRPRGVVGAISPWNLPLYLLTWKVAPAIATGNTVVAKPSELTPQTAARLGELSAEVGLPPGVLNIVHGLGAQAGAPLVAHPDVPTVSFTGGTVTGAAIARTAAPMFKRLSLELGGKNPTIVFGDVDLDETIAAIVRSSFANQGEICLCGSRLFIEDSMYDRFVARFVDQVRTLRIGDPLDPATDQGALVSNAHRQKVEHYVDLARELGGEVLTGGRRPADLPERVKDGYFVEPTVIAGLPADCAVNRDEIFGPVVTLTRFSDAAEAIGHANATAYGLSASVWTNDLQRAHRVAGAIDAGTVWVNTWLLRDLRVPFGGMKQSGVGREGGEDALRFYTEPQNICVAL